MQDIDITCSRGDTARWTINCRVDGLPIDLTGGSVVFSARRNPGSPLLFERTSAPGGGVVIDSDPATGVAEVTLAVSDTSGLYNENTELDYSVRATTSAGAWTVARGTLTVTAIANQL